MTSFYLFRSTHPEAFCKKNVPKNFAKFTENTYVGRQTSNFIKKNLKHSWFPVNFAKFLRRPILKSIEEQLLVPLTGQCPNLFAYYPLWTLRRKLYFLCSRKWERWCDPKWPQYLNYLVESRPHILSKRNICEKRSNKNPVKHLKWSFLRK